MEKNGRQSQYSHFGTVCVPVLGNHLDAPHYTTVLLRTCDTDRRVHVFRGREKVGSLTLEDARRLKMGLTDPYIDARGDFCWSGYNRVNGENRRR